MKTLVHLAGAEDSARILPLIAAYQAELGIAQDDAARAEAVMPLLDGSPHGAAYLIGPKRAPVGYMVLSFGWSIAGGGVEGVLTDLYIRPAIRRRGMASDAVRALQVGLRDSDITALHAHVAAGAPGADLVGKLGFDDLGAAPSLTWRSAG